MTRQEIIDKVKALNLPKGGYIVFGSGPLAVAGIRETNDIDMLVSDEVSEHLRAAGWQLEDKGWNDNPLTHNDFEAHVSWEFSTYAPTLQQLLATADVVDGVPFASLGEVKKWKAASGRPQDVRDLQLIDEYLASSNHVDEVVAAWKAYTDTIEDWESLVQGVTPKDTQCGPVYELPNPIDRPNEDFAIADMRGMDITGVHYHTGGQVEIYIILTGTGTVYIGGQAQAVEPGSVCVTLPETAHFTVPEHDLVLAAINVPPFDPEMAIEITETDKSVGFDADQYAKLKAEETDNQA